MCGRTRCALQPQQIEQATGVDKTEFSDAKTYVPRENVTPGQQMPIWYRNSRGELTVRFMKWGLVPSYTKADATPNYFMMFNARSETLAERPAFRRLIHAKRCIVLLNGFYEWKKVDKREKQPYYLTLAPEKDEKPAVMYLAGLYDRWQDVFSFTILTKPSCKSIQWLHDRMPVIFTTQEDARPWLEDRPYDAQALNTPKADAVLKFHPVTKRIGSAKYNEKDCADKIDIKVAADITTFFKPQPYAKKLKREN